MFSTNLSLTSRPTTDWQFGARFRNYTYSNQMPVTSITNYRPQRWEPVDDAHGRSRFSRPRPDHVRRRCDMEARLTPLALTVGYTHNGSGYDARILQSSGEDVFRVSADAVDSSMATFRAQYEVGSRTGLGLDEQQLTDIAEHPEMRHFDLADRTRNRFTGQVDIVPSDAWLFSVSGAGSCTTTSATASSGCRSRPGAPSRSPPTIACRTAWARAAATISSGIPDGSSCTKATTHRRSSTIPCATGRLTRRRPSTISPSPHAAPDWPQHRGADLVRFQPRRRQ